ncbi:MAG: hypothetical protein ABIR34_09345 [Marmoricola sp.]
MSDPNLADRPEPLTDAPPDEGPGGPADMVHRDEDDLPPATADQPRSAQVGDEQVPDEIERAEETDTDVDEDAKSVEEGTEEPS